MLPAYLVHSLVDVDWDYVAVSGADVPRRGSAGGPRRRASGGSRPSPFSRRSARRSPRSARCCCRGSATAGRARPRRRSTAPLTPSSLARRARAVDPLLVDPFFTLAFAEERQGKPNRAYAYYVEATSRQPANPQTWQAAGLYAAQVGCPRLAYDNLVHFTELDPYAPGADGGDIYNASLKIVNAGKAKC